MSGEKDLEIKWSDAVKESVAKDPELAKALWEFQANLHQAWDAVKRGQYASFEDAIEAITGERPERVKP